MMQKYRPRWVSLSQIWLNPTISSTMVRVISMKVSVISSVVELVRADVVVTNDLHCRLD